MLDEKAREAILDAIKSASRKECKEAGIPLDVRVDEPGMKRIADKIREYLTRHPKIGRYITDFRGIINVVEVNVFDYRKAEEFVGYVSTLDGVRNVELPLDSMHPMHS